jgi:hypothetical protein
MDFPVPLRAVLGESATPPFRFDSCESSARAAAGGEVGEALLPAGEIAVWCSGTGGKEDLFMKSRLMPAAKMTMHIDASITREESPFGRLGPLDAPVIFVFILNLIDAFSFIAGSEYT